jgi:hypothetical protein
MLFIVADAMSTYWRKCVDERSEETNLYHNMRAQVGLASPDTLVPVHVALKTGAHLKKKRSECSPELAKGLINMVLDGFG